MRSGGRNYCNNSMKALILLFLIIGSAIVQADCGPIKENVAIEGSKYIAVGEIISSDFSYDKNSMFCQWKQKKLTYKIKITEVISGRMFPGEYTLSYLHNCLEKPSNEIFEVSSKYIFSIKNINGSTLELGGLKCNWWGWHLGKLSNIKDSIQKYCDTETKQLESLINESKSCSKNSDCDYVAYMSPGGFDNLCHHFVNKNNVPTLKERISKINSGLCATNSALLCKAPMRQFISCRKGQCFFPKEKGKDPKAYDKKEN